MIPITAILVAIVLSNILSKQLKCGFQFQIHKRTYSLSPYVFEAVALLPVYIICAFQFSTSSDYHNYSRMFVQINQGMRSISEPLVYLIFKIISKLGLNFQWVYIVIFLIVFVILYRTLNKYSKDFVFSTAIYLCVFFGLAGLQIRQLLAVVISFAAYQYILDRKPVKFVLMIAAACMCHMSALIMLPAYFLLRYRYRLTDIAFISGFCIMIGSLSKKLFPVIISKISPSRMNWYQAYKNPTLSKWDLILLAIFLFFVIIYASRIVKNQMNILFINAFIIYLIMFFCCRWIPEVKRWGYYYFIPIIALIPNCLAEEENKSVRFFFSVILLIYLFLYLLLVYKAPLSYYSLIFLSNF